MNRPTSSVDTISSSYSCMALPLLQVFALEAVLTGSHLLQTKEKARVVTDCCCMKQKRSVDHCQCRISVSTGISKNASEQKKKFKFPKYFNSGLYFCISPKITKLQVGLVRCYLDNNNGLFQAAYLSYIVFITKE